MKTASFKNIVDSLQYFVPQEWKRRVNISTLHPLLTGQKANLGFDIFDFEMLFNDHATKRLIREGKTIGCFYIESPGMRSLLRRLNVETFEMLTAASSIIRPGVAESGMMQEFIERHKDPKRRQYLVPEMEKYLGDTYGVMIYQEDVIKVAHHVAGLTLEEADLLRRAMSGKMRSHLAMQKITTKFFQSCNSRGLTEIQAQELWRQIESFAGYSFCKAHSASFALLSCQVAFLKAHYPAEFMASVLSNGGGFYSPAVYVQESKRIGLKVMLPSINHSSYAYQGNENTLRIGLMAAKGLQKSTIEIIINERKANGRYVSLEDFLVRTHCGYQETALLIRCGAMDCLKKNRPELLRLLDIYIHRRKLLDENYKDLFSNESFLLEKEIATSQNYSIEEICRIEYETFDYMITRHPLNFFQEWISDSSVTYASEMQRNRGRKVKMIGWYMTSKRIRTKKGEIMKFLSLEDLTGTFEAVIFPKEYYRFAELTMSMGPYLIEGWVDANDPTNIVVKNLQLLSSVELKNNLMKDGVDYNYYGDVEKVSENDFMLIEGIDKEKLRLAYAS
jgi:DNA polymerase III alpha subunit